MLTVEYKLNLVASGGGRSVVACAEVIRAGGRITVCETRVFSVDGAEETLCAIAPVTLLRQRAADDPALRSKTTRTTGGSS